MARSLRPREHGAIAEAALPLVTALALGRPDTATPWLLALAAVAAFLMVASLMLPGRYAGAVLMYVAINGAVFAILVWMVIHGYRGGDRFQVYAAFIAYAANMLAVYFMDFFTLMSRSLFVMAGGAVLVAGVYLLERQRRRAQPAEGGAA